MERTDQELILGLVREKEECLAEIYDKYSAQVFRVAFSILKDRGLAEDVTQEVFIQCWRKAATYKTELASLSAWLCRISHNRAINLLRSKTHSERTREVSIDDGSESESVALGFADETASSLIIDRENSELIKLSLRSISEESRMLVDLAFFQGFSHSQIAAMLKMPLGTVKTKIRRTLSDLREKLASEGVAGS